eukprot:CAMPEP_0170648314 /NCGR_PEP_ID=MMETSP0224-20130122/44676_1 /TAXON_ID=285029 /ORGANISM="Togula jolla, Strain CCCM 725" /LENGTH=39 /DNA_ID= /DNA_START= /DNA_END= /DNA_ORIENTATION=
MAVVVTTVDSRMPRLPDRSRIVSFVSFVVVVVVAALVDS